MPGWLTIVAVAALGFLIGSIPVGLVMGRLVYHTDVREHGSGNIGATNVWRTFGWKPGLTTFLLDVLKGAVPVWLAMLIAGDTFSAAARDWVVLSAGLAAVIGHSYSPFVGFRGGKGAATSIGLVVAIAPLLAGIMMLTFGVVLVTTRYVSLGSLVLAVEYLALAPVLYPGRPALLVLGFAAAATVFWRHRANIARLWRREERRASMPWDKREAG